MPYDVAGFQPAVRVDTERARFAADLARHANEPYGARWDIWHCALSRHFGGTHFPALYRSDAWQRQFMRGYDRLPRQPTGFDCLCILQSIPA